jgi:hypothetical protein
VSEGVLVELAERFWTASGGTPASPRDLHAAVSLALPVTVVALPELTLERVESWLAARGIAHHFAVGNRRLHGCLVATGGHGYAFIDGTDPADERRFTLAHEVAHFLLDYQVPRERATRALGDDIVAVLDGKRVATAEERLGAALSDWSLTMRTHLMERTGDLGANAAAHEERADRLAWELQAPAAEVCQSVAEGRIAIEQVLIDRYGLPAAEAARYAKALRRHYAPPPSFVEWLRE